MAMKVFNAPQGTPQWKEWRKLGISASDVAAVLGLSPYKSPRQVFDEKVGLVEPEDYSRNPFVQHGHRCEPLIRAWFEDQHNEMLLPACAESDATPWIRASFDGVTSSGIPVEMKAPSNSVFDDVKALGENSNAYLTYYPQVQTQIYVAESDHGFIVFAKVEEVEGPEGPELRIIDTAEFRVPRNDAFITDMIPKLGAFVQAIQQQKCPKLDPKRDAWRPESEEDKARWSADAKRLRDLNARKKALEAELATLSTEEANIEKRLIEQMGPFASAEFDGVRINRSLTRGQIDYDSLVKDYLPDLADDDKDEYRKPGSARVRVTLQAIPTDTTPQTGDAAAQAA